ncbi:MAG: hypothetical protein KJ623_02840, partial [Nanoarchaeota archaeon]|nr:hypothetical protein [Nanoarchaeota archaeon]
MKDKIKIFSMNVLFFVSLIILFVLIKEQIVNYVTFLRDATPKLAELQTALSQNVTTNIAEAQTTINSITSQASNFMLYQYLLIPLVLFIIWVLFQGNIFFILSKSKNLKNYILKFALITIPFCLVTIILFKFLLFNWIFLIILFFMLYYLLILYLNLDKPLKIALKKPLNIKPKQFLF